MRTWWMVLLIFSLDVILATFGELSTVSISECGDIAKVTASSIAVPSGNLNGAVLSRRRSCRFAIQNLNHEVNKMTPSSLTAVLEYPFRLGPGSSVVFLDGSLRAKYRSTCSTVAHSDSARTLVITAESSQYGTLGREFTVNGTSMLIDFCGTPSKVAVKFKISLMIPHPPKLLVPNTTEIPSLSDENDVDSDNPEPLVPAGFEMPVIVENKIKDDAVTPVECGKAPSPPDVTPRIINGDTARAGNFPWSVALIHKKFKQFCGGSVVTPHWIITAAHCVIGPLELYDLLNNTVAVVGVLNLKDMGKSNSYEIDQVAVHPQYEPKGWLNDIALIRLKTPITSLTQIGGPRAICLPKRSLEDVSAAHARNGRNVTCFLSGWGYTKEAAGIAVLSQSIQAGASFAEAANGNKPTPQIGAGTDQLLYARMNFIPLDKCQKNYKIGSAVLASSEGFVRDNMLCASNEAKGQGACLGDSGGGLFCKETDDNWVVFGTSSWSGGCARKNLPSVFANVFKLKSFVDRTLSWKPPSPRVPTR